MTAGHNPSSTPSPSSCGSKAKPWSSSVAATRRWPRRALLGQSSARLRVRRGGCRTCALREWMVWPTAPSLSKPAMWYLSISTALVLVFAATGDEEASTAVFPRTPARPAILSNAVDRPELCDFFTPAIVRRAPLAVRRSAQKGAGRCSLRSCAPGSTGCCRLRLGRSPRWEFLPRTAERLQHKSVPRRAFWNEFFAGAPARARWRAGDADLAPVAPPRIAVARDRCAGPCLRSSERGPAPRTCLTLRARRLLMEADVIVHDALVPGAVVAMGRRDAERLGGRQAQGLPFQEPGRDQCSLGKASDARSKRVVRLKSGDPVVLRPRRRRYARAA